MSDVSNYAYYENVCQNHIPLKRRGFETNPSVNLASYASSSWLLLTVDMMMTERSYVSFSTSSKSRQNRDSKRTWP